MNDDTGPKRVMVGFVGSEDTMVENFATPSETARLLQAAAGGSVQDGYVFALLDSRALASGRDGAIRVLVVGDASTVGAAARRVADVYDPPEPEPRGYDDDADRGLVARLVAAFRGRLPRVSAV